MKIHCYPSESLPEQTLCVPYDKSMSHRALILSAISEGPSTLSGVLNAEDCDTTQSILERLGVSIEAEGAQRYVHGIGLRGFSPWHEPLDCQNSGTTMRLLSGVLVGQSFSSTLVGDASLSRRPMGRIVDPLRQMGAQIQASDLGCSPLIIQPTTDILGIHYSLPVPSAQVKSCLLLAGLYAKGDTVIHELSQTRDHTERMLPWFGVEVETAEGIRVSPTQPRGCDLKIPRDFSSAAFFIALIAAQPGKMLYLPDVGINPHRIGLLEVLRAMGADIQILNQRQYHSEPVADIRVIGRTLKGVNVEGSSIPSMIDEIPALCIAAVAAKGVTLIKGLSELRQKECDRLNVLMKGLMALGIQAENYGDDLRIKGGTLQSGTVDCHNDHRIIMSFILLSALSSKPFDLHGCQGIDTSFPGFIGFMPGLKIEVEAVEKANV